MRSAIACAATLLLAARVLAAPSPEELARAKQIYAVGATAFAAQLYPDAEQAFREVYEILHAPNLLYNLALTLERERKWGPAADAYEGFLRDTRGGKDRRVIEKRTAELRARAARQEESAASKQPEVEAPASSAPGNGVLKMEESDDAPPAAVLATPPPRADEAEKKPLYKKWWLWAAVGGAVAAAAVIAVAVVAGGASGPPGAMTTFPDFGPGAAGPLVRF